MNSSEGLKNRVAVITGAASGIGRAAAFLFSQKGAKLVLTDIDADGLAEVDRALGAENRPVVSQPIDVSDEHQVKGLIRLALDTYAQVDIICNNAGIGGDISSLDQQDAAVWQRVYDVNVMAAVYTTKHSVQHMQQRKYGAIVNVASVAGIRSGAGGNAYSASKAALINFTQTAACDLGAFNIRVNAVCPGLIETGMTKPVFDYARNTNKAHKLGSRCELRRYGTPDEVAQAILFLASDASSYITGQVLAVDGGNTASLNLPGMKV